MIVLLNALRDSLEIAPNFTITGNMINSSLEILLIKQILQYNRTGRMFTTCLQGSVAGVAYKITSVWTMNGITDVWECYQQRTLAAN